MGLNFAFDNFTNKIDLTYDDDGMRQCFEQALTMWRVFYNRLDAKRIADHAGSDIRPGWIVALSRKVSLMLADCILEPSNTPIPRRPGLPPEARHIKTEARLVCYGWFLG